MKYEKSKKLLERTIGLIDKQEIQEFTYNALQKTPDEFFVVPSSISGKYHTPENNIEGGLIIHTIKVSLFGYDFANHLCPEHRDSIVSACILHDTQKGMVNGKWEGYAKDHALIAYRCLEEFNLQEDYKDVIRNSVRTHMSELSHPEEEKVLALKRNLPLPQRVVQMADIASSAGYASFIPGVNINDLYGVNDDVIESLFEDNLDKVLEKVDRFKKKKR